MRINRLSLRDQAADVLREQILTGHLVPGRVLREERLAAELGVSRTPLREALLELAREGLTSKRPGRGFKVTRLEAREVRELYPLRALLESEALHQSGIPAPRRLVRLTKLNDRLAAEPPGPAWTRIDVQWHELLIDACDNRYLRSFVRRLRTHARRYEFAFMDAVGDPAPSADQHREIIRRLKVSDLDGACRTLADNMVISMAPLLAWLEPD